MTCLSPMRRRFVLGMCAAAVFPGRAFAASIFPFIPDHYTFSRKQVQAAVARKFPYRKSIEQVFDLTLSNPVVTLLPEVDRVSVLVDTQLASPFMPQPVSGALAVDSQLAFDAPSRSVVLIAPQVSKADFGAASALYGQQINAAASLLATQMLDHYPIYTFKPEELSFAGIKVAPGAIHVVRDGIQVQIVQG